MLGIFLFVGHVVAENNLHDACLRVADVALASSSEPAARGAAAAKECARTRPGGGFWAKDAAEDCAQFGAMFRLASRLSPSLTGKAFCADVRDADADGLLAAHAQCMALWSRAAGASAVQAALRDVCEAAHGPACSQFALSLNDGADLNKRSLCDHALTNGSGTWALDASHLQYSCRQLAPNCAGSDHCMAGLEAHCSKGGFPADFCGSFRGLVDAVRKGTANNEKVESFCAAHADVEASPQVAPAPSAPPAPKPAAPAAAQPPAQLHVQAAEPARAAGAPAPPAPPAPPTPLAQDVPASTGAVTDRAADSDAALTDCEEHTKQILALGLAADELQHVTTEVCEKKYTASICGNFTSLVAKAASAAESGRAGALHDACRVAISQNPFDMFSVCKQVVEKVDGTELEGGAFQKASFEVCSRLLERDMKTVDAPIVDGCNYFSTQLVAARTKGPVKTDQFCSQLTGGGDGRSAATDTDAEPVKTSLAELSPKVEVSSEKAPLRVETSLMEGGSRKVLLRKASNVAHPDTLHEVGPKAAAPPSKKASKEDEDFLNNFLDSYDAQQKKKNAPESAAPKPPTLQQRVQKAFPESQQVQPGSNVDDVISDFLSSYDSKPHA